MTGQQLYEVWRAAMNAAGAGRGHTPEPRWKDLKPWLKLVWERTAAILAPTPCGCREHCGDDGDVDGPGVCKDLPREPERPLVKIVMVPRR